MIHTSGWVGSWGLLCLCVSMVVCVICWEHGVEDQNTVPGPRGNSLSPCRPPCTLPLSLSISQSLSQPIVLPILISLSLTLSLSLVLSLSPSFFPLSLSLLQCFCTTPLILSLSVYVCNVQTHRHSYIALSSCNVEFELRNRVGQSEHGYRTQFGRAIQNSLCLLDIHTHTIKKNTQKTSYTPPYSVLHIISSGE